MSQAESLLNSMSDEIPVHTHPVPDTDTYFIINPITRKIENTNRKKTVIMQYDHNSERFTFELPRYIDGHDMLECTSVTVNVDNIEVVDDAELQVNSDAPDMTDLRVHPNDPEKVISSWLISRNSTRLAGILSFHIEYKCVDSDGNVVYEWGTDTYNEIEVRARKKNGEAAVAEYSDVLEQWRASIFGAGDSVMANIVAEGETQVAAVKAESTTQQEAVELKGAQTLDSIPEDYTTVDAMADEAVRSKGDAIVCETSGESITLKNSSDDHIRGLRLFGKSTQATTTGKNLFKTGFISGYTETVKGVTFTVNPDRSIHVKGTPNAAIAYNIFEGEVLPVGNYFVSGAPETASQKFRLQVNLTVNGTEQTGGVDMGVGSKFSVNTSVSSLRGYIYVAADAGAVDGLFYPQIELGSTATPYEPYTGGKPSPNPEYPQAIVSIENPIAYVHGKNLADSNAIVRTVQANVTTDSNNIYVKKTNTGNIYSNFYYRLGTWNEFVGKTITVSIENASDYVWHMHIGDLDTANAWVADNALKSRSVEGRTKTILTATVPKNDNASFIGLRFVSSDTSISDETYILRNLQVEVGDTATEYEPYRPISSTSINRTLHGIPVTSGGNYTDSDGQQWICDEIDLERGVYVQRINEVIYDGVGETWYKSSNNENVYLYHVSVKQEKAPGSGNCFCDRLNRKSTSEIQVEGDLLSAVGISPSPKYNVMYVNVGHFLAENTLDAFVEYLAEHPLTVNYVLATPIETPLTAEEIAAFKALRTNYPNTTILNDAGAWMSVKYNADTKTYVENPKVLKLVDSSTGVVYELKIVDGNLTVIPV